MRIRVVLEENNLEKDEKEERKNEILDPKINGKDWRNPLKVVEIIFTAGKRRITCDFIKTTYDITLDSH